MSSEVPMEDILEEEYEDDVIELNLIEDVSISLEKKCRRTSEVWNHFDLVLSTTKDNKLQA
jgi:hypothetical protein